MKSLVLLCVAVCVAPQGGPRNYMMKDRTVVSAEILAVRGDRVDMKLYAAGGSSRVEHALSDFAPQSAFRILRRTSDQDSIADHVKLADFAIDHGLLSAGRRELNKARDLAHVSAPFADLEQKWRHKVVEVLHGMLEELIASGKLKDAYFVVAQIIMEAPRMTEEEKRALFGSVEAKIDELKAENSAVAKSEAPPEVKEQRAKLIKRIEDRVARGDASRLEALLASRSFSLATSHFGRAIDAYQAAQRGAAVLQNKYQDDPVLVREFAILMVEAQQKGISCLLSQAAFYTIRGQFSSAMERATRALVLDPDNEQATWARARIEIEAHRAGWEW